ncbi:MAG: hypothetical protein D6734_08450 [Candidatus Schekmanbacteria bacterium]|nr:MAG: hypothetical protein D6734_08450 [Candidatus Schekmanbacteria bacterium]
MQEKKTFKIVFFIFLLISIFYSPFQTIEAQYTIKNNTLKPVRKRASKKKTIRIKTGQTLNKRLTKSDRKYADGTPYDKYKYFANKSKTITIEMTSNEVDSYLFLFRKRGRSLKLLAQDNDSGNNFNALITYKLPKRGIYIIYANSIGTNLYGRYSISITKKGREKGNLSGTIIVPDFNAINEIEPNNGLDTAQKIKALPVSVFGKAADSDKGTELSLQNATVHDFYQIDTSYPISITLRSRSSADLDLYLFDGWGETLGISNNSGSSNESLSYEPCTPFSFYPCTASITYTVYVGVSAYSGEGSYQLNIDYINYGQSLSSTKKKEDLKADFVPGEAIVKFKITNENNDDKRYKILSPNKKSRIKLIKFNIQKPSAAAKISSYSEYEKAQTLKKIEELKKDKNVIYAEPNYIYKPLTVPNDEFYDRQWHYKAIHLPEAWDITTGDDNIIIAVIDTGISPKHPDLKDKLIKGKGYDFISDPSNAGDGDGLDSNPRDPGDGNPQKGKPSSFHGTHVAGTIAASTDNSIGVAGINWKGKIMSLRALGKNGGTSYDISQAIRYAAGLSNDSGKVPEQKADVINMSLGGPGFSQTMNDAVQAAIDAGVTIVAAAGNENSSVPSYPASYDNVISVSAVDFNLERAFYSNYGSKITIAAPGGDTGADNNNDGYPDGVLSTIDDDDGNKGYVYYQGTSMAAPHVAGVVALMQAARLEKGLSKLTPSEIKTILTETATDLGSPGWDQFYGYGLINAAKAVKKAIEEAGTPVTNSPILSVSANEIKFGTSNKSAKFTISNTGTADLTITSITKNEDWLTITSTNTITGTLSPGETIVYNISVSRSGLEDGKYLDTITITTDAGNATIAVSMQVGKSTNSRDIGKIFILAIDATTFNSTKEAETDFSKSYSFSLTNLPKGSYYIVAGTDRDNDFLICDEGEACGFYPTSDQPIPVFIDNGDDITDIDFPIEEDLSFQRKESGLGMEGFKLLNGKNK